MKKELRPVHDAVTCESAGAPSSRGSARSRTSLPAGIATRSATCAPCALSTAAGSASRGGGPAPPVGSPRAAPRAVGPDAPAASRAGAQEEMTEAEARPCPPRARRRRSTRTPSRPRGPAAALAAKDPRHVRAVPPPRRRRSTARWISSTAPKHQRTIAGWPAPGRTGRVRAARSRPRQPGLGRGRVGAAWYRYRVDLGERASP